MSDYDNDVPYALQRNPETNKLNGASNKDMKEWRAKAIKYRKLRMNMKKRLKTDLSIVDFLSKWDTYTEDEQKAFGNFKMIDIVTTMHYVGKKRGFRLLEEAKITSKRRLGALILNKTQMKRFVRVVETKL